jgi:hypothetical protein
VPFLFGASPHHTLRPQETARAGRAWQLLYHYSYHNAYLQKSPVCGVLRRETTASTSES